MLISGAANDEGKVVLVDGGWVYPVAIGYVPEAATSVDRLDVVWIADLFYCWILCVCCLRSVLHDVCGEVAILVEVQSVHSLWKWRRTLRHLFEAMTKMGFLIKSRTEKRDHLNSMAAN